LKENWVFSLWELMVFWFTRTQI